MTTRDALIDAAADLIEEGGVRAVTLREVGRRAGVSHNAPYKHFQNREDLLAAVAARELRRPRSRRSRATLSSVSMVRAMMHGYVRHALAHPELFKLTYGRWETDNAELAEAAETARNDLVRAVIEAQAAGDLPAGDPERVTALVLATAHGAADLALSGHLAKDGKGNASAGDLVDDLLAHLGSRT